MRAHMLVWSAFSVSFVGSLAKVISCQKRLKRARKAEKMVFKDKNVLGKIKDTFETDD